MTSTGTFSVSGTLSGLSSGAQLTVTNNGSDPLTLTANGNFSFDVPATSNGNYLVVVADQPAGETCTVSNYSGAGITSNVANVNVTCSVDTYPISGAVSGLTPGTQVVLKDNGADTLTVAADGPFSFATPVPYQGSYNVTVGTQPTGQTCTVAKGAGVSVIEPVTNINVVCATDTFSIGGNVAGLSSGAQVTLDNNSADPLTITANGSFTFAAPVAYDGTYNVTIGTQPTGQTCTVTKGSGIATAMNITNITIACSTKTFTIGGSITGLAAGTELVLDDNGADPLTLTANGKFTFATPVSYNGSFDITVGTQPVGQTCTVTGGVGTSVSNNITTSSVLCAADTYTIGGSVTGLTTDGLVLKNNGDDALPVSEGSTSFQFTTPVAYGSGYSVIVFEQPLGEICTVANGSSPTGNANVTNVVVSCIANPPTVSCSANPSTVNSGDPSTITSSGVSPGNLPLTYSFSATAGSISGNTSTAILSTVGAAPGTVITVTCDVVDTKGQTASVFTTVTVNAPPPPP